MISVMSISLSHCGAAADRPLSMSCESIVIHNTEGLSKAAVSFKVSHHSSHEVTHKIHQCILDIRVLPQGEGFMHSTKMQWMSTLSIGGVVRRSGPSKVIAAWPVGVIWRAKMSSRIYRIYSYIQD